MKRIISILLAAMLVLSCMCGCAKETEKPEDENQTGGEQTAVVSQTDGDIVETEQEPEKPKEKISNDTFNGTYWSAVTWEVNESEYEFYEMPWEGWTVDIILYEDGSCRFLSVMNDSYTENAEGFADGSWYLDPDSSLIYINSQNGRDQYFAKYENGKLYIELYDGIMCFEQGKMPAPGAQWSIADLEGAWELESVEVEGCPFDAEEEGLYGSVCFFEGEEGLTANYVYSTSYGYEESFSDTAVVYQDCALYDGCPNEVWSAQLMAENPDEEHTIEYYIALTDRNTMVMMVFTKYSEDEYPVVSVHTYSYQGTEAVG